MCQVSISELLPLPYRSNLRGLLFLSAHYPVWLHYTLTTRAFTWILHVWRGSYHIHMEYMGNHGPLRYGVAAATSPGGKPEIIDSLRRSKKPYSVEPLWFYLTLRRPCDVVTRKRVLPIVTTYTERGSEGSQQIFLI